MLIFADVKSPQGVRITLSNVLHVLGVQTCFISIGTLTGKGASVNFLKNGFKITLNNRLIAIGYLEGHLYWLNTTQVSLNSHVNSAPSLHTWHQCMGHMSHTALKSHGPKAVTGLDLDASTMAIPKMCHGCKTGKSTCKPFPGSAKITSRILEVVHSDLSGPMQVKSIQGSLYTATFVDDYSCHAVVYCLWSKDQFVVALQKFLSWAETQTSEKMHTLHSDRGGKYMAASVKDILNQRGIEYLLTMPGTPQQNGKAEQFNRTIMDKAMSMLHTTALSNGFWEHAISMATHIYNRTPIHSLKWHTPHEAWNAGHVPDVSYFRVFGCKAYMHVPADKRCKLDTKAVQVTFVGYEPGSKGYRLWDKNTRSVHLSRDVTFDESSFPSRDKETSPAPTSQTIIPFYPVYAEPNMPAMPQLRAPSPALTEGSKDDVEDILLPKVEQPQIPPMQGPTLPSTPKKEQKPPTSPPPRQSAVRTEQLPLTPELRMPRGMQQQLRQVGVAPRQSAHVPVPNPRYFNANNVAQRGRRLSNASSLLDLLPPPSLLVLVLPCPLRLLPSILALPCLGLCRFEPHLCLLLPFRWPSDRRRLENFPPPRPPLLPLLMLPPPLRSRLCPRKIGISKRISPLGIVE